MLSAVENAFPGVLDMQAHGGARGRLVSRSNGVHNDLVLELPPQQPVTRLDQRKISVKRDADGNLGVERGQCGASFRPPDTDGFQAGPLKRSETKVEPWCLFGVRHSSSSSVLAEIADVADTAKTLNNAE